MRKVFYAAPEVDVVEVAVEGGFNISSYSDSMDYGDGGTGDEMD